MKQGALLVSRRKQENVLSFFLGLSIRNVKPLRAKNHIQHFSYFLYFPDVVSNKHGNMFDQKMIIEIRINSQCAYYCPGISDTSKTVIMYSHEHHV